MAMEELVAANVDMTISQQPAIRPYLELGLNAAHFDEKAFQAATRELKPYFQVGGGRSITLSEVPPPTVVFTFLLATLQALPAGILANILTGPVCNTIKAHLLKPKHASSSIVIFKAVQGYEQIVYSVETSDIEVVREVATRFATDIKQANHRPKARQTPRSRRK